MNDDQRAEAVEVVTDLLWDYDPEYETRAGSGAAIVDALTKPRTGPCEACGGTGTQLSYNQPSSVMMGGRVVQVHDGMEFSTKCDRCSGSGTVTRGPIAVLVDGGLEHRVAEDTTIVEDDDGLLWSQGETGPLKPLYTIVARRTGEG